jgi:ApaG protein
MNKHLSDQTTNGIRIQAASQFLARESEPDSGRYVFTYEITMTNDGDVPARLLSRHWIIVDGEGRREDVRGRGVVGAYPHLAPGESYTYKSYCPIATPWGTMEGSYTFVRDDGGRFDVAIGRFFLVPTPQGVLQ